MQKKPQKQEAKEPTYRGIITSIKRVKNPEEQLNLTDKFFKEFLNKNYGVSQKLDLYETEKLFECKNKLIADFCRLLIEAYYSGERVDGLRMGKILHEFEKITNNISEEVPVAKENSPHKYYHSGEHKVPNPPVNQHLIIKPSNIAKHQDGPRVSTGKDHERNVSFFTHKDHAAHAKHHLNHAKHHMKNIHHSLAHSKKGAIDENLSIGGWADSLGDLKSEIIDDCKKVISKL